MEWQKGNKKKKGYVVSDTDAIRMMLMRMLMLMLVGKLGRK